MQLLCFWMEGALNAPRVLVWRLEETLLPHLAWCTAINRISFREAERKKQSPETSARVDKCLLLSKLGCIFTLHCCSWRAHPANTLGSLFQVCRNCFVTERESSAGRGYSQKWQSLECPSLSPDGGSNSAHGCLLWDFATLANKKPWEWNMRAAFLQHGYSVTDTPCNYFVFFKSGMMNIEKVKLRVEMASIVCELSLKRIFCR